MNKPTTPLAERLRPKTLEEVVGQEHLTGVNGVLKKIVDQGNLTSLILWGPPGTGKTTLAQVIAQTLDRPFFTLSAISSGVKDVREVIATAAKMEGTILFIDEIHRFNKGQQDALLGAVEKGVITLIGATTENPSFEVNAALLSRCQVYILRPLEKETLNKLLNRALKEDKWLSEKKVVIKEDNALMRIADGDARRLLNLFELVVNSLGEKTKTNPSLFEITDQKVMETAQQQVALYDKGGEQHYDIISAFIKSIRGSDPNAAVYWLARMIEGGEDVKFIARRLVILASEDIGNANPTALVLASNTFQAVNQIGYPESRIILAQCVTYLASSPKSNASYMAINKAQSVARKRGNLPVPLDLRNAPTKLMREQGYSKGYQYAHDYEKNFVLQEYLPHALSGTTFYNPGNNPRENKLREYLKSLWKDKYGY